MKYLDSYRKVRKGNNARRKPSYADVRSAQVGKRLMARDEAITVLPAHNRREAVRPPKAKRLGTAQPLRNSHRVPTRQPYYPVKKVITPVPSRLHIGDWVQVSRWGRGQVTGFWRDFVVIRSRDFGQAVGCTGGFPADRCQVVVA